MDAAKLLRSMLLEIDPDDTVLARDTIEAETNLTEAIHAVLSDLLEDEISLAGLAVIIKQLTERQERISFRVDKRKAAIQKALELAEVRRLDFPEGSVGLRRVPPGLFIEAEKKIPAQYFEPQEPKLNKSQLKFDLKAGKSIDGCRLDNGSTTLQIHRR